MSLSIPKNLIANLDAAFQREGKKLALDIAKALKIPDKDALDIIKKMEKISYKIYDTDDHDTTCPVFLPDSKVIQRCRRPCLLGTSRCIHHQECLPPPNPSPNCKELTRCISALGDLQHKHMLYDEETNMIYNLNGELMGEVVDDEDYCNKKILYEFVYEDCQDELKEG
jgi:hypothetical protein